MTDSVTEIVHELRMSGDPKEEQWAAEIERLRAQLAQSENRVRKLQAHPGERYWECRWRDTDAELAIAVWHIAEMTDRLASAKKALDLTEYVSRKDSLTEQERLSSVRTVVCAAISSLTDENSK